MKLQRLETIIRKHLNESPSNLKSYSQNRKQWLMLLSNMFEDASEKYSGDINKLKIYADSLKKEIDNELKRRYEQGQ